MPADSPSPVSPPPRKKRRWLRRIVGFLVFLFVLVLLAPLALGLAPVRRWVAERASEAIQHRVTIGGLSAAWWSGIEVRDLEIHNPEGWTGDPLLSVDRVHVDVSTWKALTGTIDAHATIEKPVATLVRDANGRSNWDGPWGKEKTPRDREKKERVRASVGAVLQGGRIVAHGAPGAAGRPDVIDEISGDMVLTEGALRHVLVTALARGAGVGGKDVRLAAETTADANGSGDLDVELPPLDLSRLQSTLRSMCGIEDASGTLEAVVHVKRAEDGTPGGEAKVSATGLKAKKGSASVTLDAATLSLKPSQGEGRTRWDLGLELTRFVAKGFSKRDAGLEEPRLRLAGTLLEREEGTWDVGTAEAPLRIEGRTLSGTIRGTVKASGVATDADLEARIGATLSPTLGRLLGVLASEDDDLRGAVSLTAAVHSSQGKRTLHLDGEIKDLVIGGATGSAPYAEPTVTLGADGTWDPAAKTLTLDRALLSAGAISAVANPPFIVTAGDPPTISGLATVDVDVARLAGLKALFPELASVRGGQLHAEVRAQGGPESPATFGIKGTDLAFEPGTLSSHGFVERNFVLGGAYRRASKTTSVLSIAELRTTLLRLTPGRPPVEIRWSEGGPSFDGSISLELSLTSLGSAFDLAVGLAPGEAMSGQVNAVVNGKASRDAAALEISVKGKDVRLPRTTAPETLELSASILRTMKSEVVEIERARLVGYGLTVSGTATVSMGAAGSGPGRSDSTGPSVRRASFTAQGDLGAARPLLSMLGAIPQGGSVSGSLSSTIDMKAEGVGRALTGTTKLQRLHVEGARDPAKGTSTSFDEPTVLLEHRITFDTEPGLTRIEKLSLVSGALTANVKGTAREQAGSQTLSLSADVEGDAARLAERVRAVLGKGYEDTAGEGRLTGKLSLVGPTEEDGRGLTMDGELSFRRISSGGLSLEQGRLTVSRPKAATPVAVNLTSRINSGTLVTEAAIDLGKGQSPWTAKTTIRGMDTSPLLTGQGAAHWLTLVLPAIVPASTSASVLSGLLDADLDLRSKSIHQPMLADTLMGGPSTLRMTQGAVKDSTLFAGLKGGGKGIASLVKLVPGVGKEIDELSRALQFQELSSRFVIGDRRIHLDPVLLTSPSVSLRFTGDVTFDGAMELKVPMKLTGSAGRAIEPYVHDSTIPLKVTAKAGSQPHVLPDLKLENVGKGLVDDLLKGLGK